MVKLSIAKSKVINPVFPSGLKCFLKEEFLDPMGLTAYRVSQGTGITESTLSKIIKGKLNLSTVNGLKLARFFGLSDDYFSKIQMQYDLDKARIEQKKSLSKIIQFVPEQERLLEA